MGFSAHYRNPQLRASRNWKCALGCYPKGPSDAQTQNLRLVCFFDWQLDISLDMGALQQ